MRDFQDKVDAAKLAGEEWVQTSPKIISYYNRKGLGTAKFFIFHDIKVTDYETDIEALEQEMDTPLALKKHGTKEGVVLGNPS